MWGLFRFSGSPNTFLPNFRDFSSFAPENFSHSSDFPLPSLLSRTTPAPHQFKVLAFSKADKEFVHIWKLFSLDISLSLQLREGEKTQNGPRAKTIFEMTRPAKFSPTSLAGGNNRNEGLTKAEPLAISTSVKELRCKNLNRRQNQ